MEHRLLTIRSHPWLVDLGERALIASRDMRESFPPRARAESFHPERLGQRGVADG